MDWLISIMFLLSERSLKKLPSTGTDNPEEIVASTPYGIYVAQIKGGSVQPQSGEFNFSVNRAYLIEKGPIKHDKLRDMINRGINASAAMLVINPEARSTYHIGIDNQNFSSGSIHYVGSEIRAVIMNKLHVELQDSIPTGSAASIAVEAAMIANEGSVIAVEYEQRDRDTMEENITKFGLQNVTVLPQITEQTMQGLPVPRLAFLAVSYTHLAVKPKTAPTVGCTVGAVLIQALQRFRSVSHFSSTYFCASAIRCSLPGLKQCLKRPCSRMNSSTGSLFFGL